MKALTLYQPHAFLIGIGAKLYETRSWKTNFRGLLAIHAGGDCRKNCKGLLVDSGAKEPVIAAPFDRYVKNDWHFIYGEMNNGGVEALVVVENCWRTETVKSALEKDLKKHRVDTLEYRQVEEAMSFGDFGPGRWAWQLRLECWVQGNAGGVIRGHQGLWNLPAKVEEAVLAAYQKSDGGMICKVCGCTEINACMTATGPCHWEKPFLCSNCVAATGRKS